MGTRIFDVPETDKERKPTNQIRREKRLLRRGLKRRRQRMNSLRAMFLAHGLIAADTKSALTAPGIDPWQLRAEGLERPLNGFELAVVLGHIAKHRGFKSNSKRDRGNNAADDSSKMLSAIAKTAERLGKYRTVGEMFFKDPEFKDRKRNRDGDYSRSVLRDDQAREVAVLFSRQRAMGNGIASPDLEREFTAEAFFQRPLQDSEHLVGPCPFEPDHKRAAKHSPAFELFRLASRLTSLRIKTGGVESPLSPTEVARAMDDFGAPGVRLTYGRLRKILNLPDGALFDVPLAEEAKREIASRHSDQAEGTKTLRKILGDAWKSLAATPDKADQVAFVLAFRDDLESIRTGLADLNLDPPILAALVRAVDQGDFAHFKGAGHISAKAARNILPHLMQGLVYSDACKAAGYDHAKRPETNLHDIKNPIARKALSEAIKQIRTIVRAHGLPGRIHIELARDVGKSRDEREKIKSGIEKRNKTKDWMREKFAEDVGRAPTGAEDLLRYELWREQATRCVYCDSPINVNQIVATDNTIQVDHILPWSRSGDDSFINKTLCHAKCNQDKKGQTPFEWLGKDNPRWEKFVADIESNKAFRGRKKRNYLLRDASILEEKFRPRNLTDTQYATRLLAEMLRQWYPDGGTRHVFTRPGALTNRLRQAWGIQGLKKDADGKRKSDDRHHALDAVIIAATTESALNRLTRAAQKEEQRGSSRFINDFPPPWPGFVAELRAKMVEIFVSRAERGRIRGEAHAATIRSIVITEDGTVVYERKSIDKLTLKDLDGIKDKDRNAPIIQSLRSWIEAGKPKDTPPLSPKGDPIRKISVASNKKPDVLVRDGAADRGEMVRVDVFRAPNKRGAYEYFLVPIYPHQVADHENYKDAPNFAVRGGKDEADWIAMTSEYEFIFSLYQNSFVEIEKSDGTNIDGYFRGMDRSTAAINVSPHQDSQTLIRSIGVKTLKKFTKISVDRLGGRFAIERETRTWRGVACT
jgi:CRISPR-associated endonuclease Csn1